MGDAENRQSLGEVLTPFRWDLLGFGFCRAWVTGLLAYSANQIWTSGASLSLQLTMFFSMAAVALVLVIVSKTSFSQHLRRKEKPTAYCIGAIGLIGMICIILGNYDGHIGLFYVGFLAAGLCGGYYETVWGNKFTRLSTSGIQVYTLFVMAVSSLSGIAMGFLPEVGFYLVSSILIGLTVVLYVADPIKAKKPTFQVLSQDTQKRGRRALLNILISYFLFSLIYNVVVSLTYDSLPSEDASFIRFWANLIAALLLLCTFLVMKPISVRMLFRLILPITAIGFVLYLISPHTLGEIALLVSSCGRKFFDILTWILVAQVVKQFAFVPERYFGLLTLGKNIGYAGGLIIASGALGALNSNVIQIATFVPVLLLALIVCFFWLFPEKTIDNLFETSTHTKKSHRDTLEESVTELAVAHSLTPREIEVFELLAQGRNLSVIMDKLGISKGTTHTHIIHVYQKLEVHKQQELIELVENYEPKAD